MENSASQLRYKALAALFSQTPEDDMIEYVLALMEKHMSPLSMMRVKERSAAWLNQDVSPDHDPPTVRDMLYDILAKRAGTLYFRQPRSGADFQGGTMWLTFGHKQPCVAILGEPDGTAVAFRCTERKVDAWVIREDTSPEDRGAWVLAASGGLWGNEGEGAALHAENALPADPPLHSRMPRKATEYRVFYANKMAPLVECAWALLEGIIKKHGI